MPRILNRILLTTVFVLSATTACPAAEAEDQADLVTATLLADVDAAVPGQTFTVGVRLKMKPHWHTYWVNPGESGDATKIALTGPAGFTFGAIRWPLPTRIDAPGGISFGYENEVLLMVPVTVGKEASTGAPAVIDAKISWLVCKETCIKGGATLQLSLPIGTTGKPANADLFKTWQHKLPVSRETPGANEAILKIDPPALDEQSSGRSLTVRWKQAPRQVEWFPVSTRAVAIEDVTVKQDGDVTRIAFNPTVYNADQVPGGLVQSVLVYEDAAGERRGISVPVHVTGPN